MCVCVCVRVCECVCVRVYVSQRENTGMIKACGDKPVSQAPQFATRPRRSLVRSDTLRQTLLVSIAVTAFALMNCTILLSSLLHLLLSNLILMSYPSFLLSICSFAESMENINTVFVKVLSLQRHIHTQMQTPLDTV